MTDAAPVLSLVTVLVNNMEASVGFYRRLGVNIAMYALCLDYKEDQVHIPFIMKRRRI